MSINLNVIQEKMMTIMQAIGQNKYLQAVMRGMMLVLPATIMSSVATLLKVFPFAPYQEFLVAHDLGKYFDMPINFTNNFLAVIVSFSVAYTLAKTFDRITSYNVCYTKLLRIGQNSINKQGTRTYFLQLDIELRQLRPFKQRTI